MANIVFHKNIMHILFQRYSVYRQRQTDWEQLNNRKVNSW